MKKLKKAIKSFWLWLGDKCECGGNIVAWSSKKSYCDKCGKVQ